MKQIVTGLLALIFSAASFGVEIKPITQVNDINKVGEEYYSKQVSWFQGDSIKFDVYARDVRTPIDFTGQAFPVLFVTAETNRQLVYMAQTGTVVNATNGHVSVTVPASGATLDTNQNYTAWMIVFRESGGVTAEVATVAYSQAQVLPSPLGVTYTNVQPITNFYINVGGIVSEYDPVFTASVAYAITSGMTSQWTQAYNWGDASTQNLGKGWSRYPATQDVNFAQYYATNLGGIDFDLTPSGSIAPGRMQWNPDMETVRLGLDAAVSLDIGQQQVAFVRNAESATISNGTVVYISGATGDKATVKVASYSNDTLSARTIGIAAEDIVSGGTGFVVTRGPVYAQKTDTFSQGSMLYLGAYGNVTTNRPSAPLHGVFVGVVEKVNANAGVIYVAVQNGFEMDELHDVNVSGVTNGQLLKYNGTVWTNANAAYLPLAGGTMAGDINMSSQSITNIGLLNSSGYEIAFDTGQFDGSWVFISQPTIPGYLTSTGAAAIYLPLNGGAVTGSITMSGDNNIVITNSFSGGNAIQATMKGTAGYEGLLINDNGTLGGSYLVFKRNGTNEYTFDNSLANFHGNKITNAVIDGYLTAALAASTYATGTPLYEVDLTPYATGTPIYSVAGLATGVPLYEVDLSPYATGTPIYSVNGLATGTPLYEVDLSPYATGTPIYSVAGLATGTPLYTETDPIWSAASNSYYTAAQVDSAFATGTPIYSLAGYATGTPLYAYTETDTIATNALANYLPLAGGTITGSVNASSLTVSNPTLGEFILSDSSSKGVLIGSSAGTSTMYFSPANTNEMIGIRGGRLVIRNESDNVSFIIAPDGIYDQNGDEIFNPSGRLRQPISETATLGIVTAQTVTATSFIGSFIGNGSSITNLTLTGYGLATGTPLYVETDPIWTAASSLYYTAAQVDAAFATGTPIYSLAGYATGTPLYAFTESDPIWIAASSSYYTASQADALFATGSPVYSLAGYATGTPLYAFNESDPIYAANSNRLNLLEAYTNRAALALDSNAWATADSTTNYQSRSEFVASSNDINVRLVAVEGYTNRADAALDSNTWATADSTTNYASRVDYNAFVAGFVSSVSNWAIYPANATVDMGQQNFTNAATISRVTNSINFNAGTLGGTWTFSSQPSIPGYLTTNGSAANLVSFPSSLLTVSSGNTNYLRHTTANPTNATYPGQWNQFTYTYRDATSIIMKVYGPSNKWYGIVLNELPIE